jgi:DNA repair protein RecO (recombination protein O)
MFRTPVAALVGQAWPKNVGQDLRKFLMQIVQRHLDKKLVTLPMLGKLA